jgi:hypothetical protein
LTPKVLAAAPILARFSEKFQKLKNSWQLKLKYPFKGILKISVKRKEKYNGLRLFSTIR